MPALALANEATANRFVCAFRESPGGMSHQVVALRIGSPLENYPPTWYVAEEISTTTFNSFTPPSGIDPRFFEVGIAGRENGSVDIVITDYDDNSAPAQYQIKCIQYMSPFSAGVDTTRVDAGTFTADMDPAVAIANWQNELRRIILWDGYSEALGETRLTANFDPPHFGGTGLAGPEQPDDLRSSIEAPSVCTMNSVSPNPFNPSTAISYELRAASYVSLRVYDTAGRLVETLVNGWREAGEHEVTFDGSTLPSGVYLYRLEAGEYSAAGKLILLK